MVVGVTRKMGRKKSGKDEPKGVVVRGSQEWRDWVTGLADFRRLKVTDLIDQALVEYAERHGYKPSAPKR
jgi:hypothetical protein